MRCPICQAELKVGGQKRLETLYEHVFDPDGTPFLKDCYQCFNKSCIAYQDKLVWDRWGGYYSGNNWNKKYSFIDNNSGPFGSLERQLNVEIYKHDEDFVLLNLYWVKLRIEYQYTANEEGVILKRRPFIRVLIRKKDDVYCWYYNRVIEKVNRILLNQ